MGFFPVGHFLHFGGFPRNQWEIFGYFVGYIQEKAPPREKVPWKVLRFLGKYDILMVSSPNHHHLRRKT
jgi:hypothetical protein